MSPINGQAVDSFVRSEGERVQHFIGSRCWCGGKDGQLDPNCRVHDVTGSVYADPQVITGLFTDLTQKKELASTGFFLPGDAIFSPESSVSVSEGDKIVLLTPIPYGKGDALIRGNTESDNLFYRADSALFCMDENKIQYRQGEDFTFDGKRIVWKWTGKTGKTPLMGVRYTVKYKGFVEWIAFVPPMERFSHGTDIGSKVMLRKLHLLGAP